jgi:hypothetical protein
VSFGVAEPANAAHATSKMRDRNFMGVSVRPGRSDDTLRLADMR